MISAILLAGGKSRRMGQDKATLPFGDTSLGLYVAHTLLTLADDLVVVTANADWFPGLTVVPDQFPDKGPLEGLATGLAHIRNDWALLAACDMPHLTRDLLDALWAHRDTGLVIVPWTSNGLEPFGALYHRKLLPHVRQTLGAGEQSLKSFIQRVPHTRIPLIGTDYFHNLNRPQDYHRALAAIQRQE